MKRRTMLTALAVAVGGSQVAPKLLAQGTGTSEPVGVSQDAAQIAREFRVSREQRLTIRLETGGGIKIVGTDDDLVSVRLYAGGRDWKDCKFEAEETASGVNISSRYAGREKSYSTSLSFEIRVPRNFNVEIESGGGDIQIAGVEGVVRGRTMGGGIVLSGLKGQVEMATMGGDVTLDASQVDGHVATMGGTVLIRDTAGDVKGSSGSGRVIYSNVTDRAGRLTER